ncbi:MAG: hypothetical protein HY321_16855 [Armatimonadetes bacterium]|nr:hypothetical protein [Armatimonadota bacterium]
MLREATKLLHRRKAIHPLLPGLPFRVAAADAYELFATEHGCCSACRVRRAWKGKKKKRLVTEYCRRVVVLQLIGVAPRVVVDEEPVLPGEGEVKAATRLEETTQRTRRGKEWQIERAHQTWHRVTTLAGAELSAALAHQPGHWRWDIENGLMHW